MIQYPMKNEMTNFHAFLLVLTLIVLSILFLGGCVKQEVHMASKESCVDGPTSVIIGGRVYCAEEDVKRKSKVKL